MEPDDKLPTLPQTEAIILAVLLGSAGREMYGLEILEDSKGELKRGTIYVTLQRMEEKGLVESRKEARVMPEIGIARRLYRVTGVGQRAFNAYKIAHSRLSGLLSPA